MFEKIKKYMACCHNKHDFFDNCILKNKLLSLDGKALHSITRTGDQLKEFLNKKAEDLGVTLPQVHLLWVLNFGEHEYLTQAEISDKLNSSKANVSTLLERMEKLDLVRREKDDVNKKINKIFITKKGIKTITELQPKMNPIFDMIFKGISDAEKETLILVLLKVRDNIK